MTEAPEERAAPRNSRRKIAVAVVLAVAVATVGSGLYYRWYRGTHLSTDDAFVEGTVYTVAARVPGTVAEVLVRDNQAVKAGEPLLRIDPEPYDVREAAAGSDLAATSAELKAAGETLAAGRADLARMRAAVDAARAKARLSEARLAQAGRDAARARSLFEKKTVSREEYEKASTEAEVARAESDLAREELRLAQASIPVQEAAVAGNEARVQQQAALVEQKKSLLAEARLNRRYTTVEAPAGGYVTKKGVARGEVVSAGRPLLAVASLADVWIVANFKETQIEGIRPGRPVSVRVDSYPGREFKGKVESLMAGTGSAFSLFPPENATGNYVKVVQRVPVKIVLDRGADPEHVLRIGMSVVPTVLAR